jgi:hypothetical protein
MGDVPKTQASVANGELPTKPGPDTLHNILTTGHAQLASDPQGVTKILQASIPPNLHFTGASLPFIEKRIGTLDAFFLRNPEDQARQTAIDAHALGTPELWNPWTGEIRPIANVHRTGNSVHIPLDLDPYGSLLLIFDPDTRPTGQPVVMSPPALPKLQIAVGKNGWQFHGEGIGPASHPEVIDLKMSSLEDWSLTNQLKHFSGRGQYTTTVAVPETLLSSHSRIILDLGDVKDVAQICINGNPGPHLLLQPYRADITSLLHSGDNTLQITVTNALFNALSANGPSANYLPEQTDTSNGLLPAGLIGPVRLEQIDSAQTP